MKRLPAALLCLALVACVRADQVGEVSTAFILIGANHKVVVDAYDDPKVKGVTCYVSRAKTGGVIAFTDKKMDDQEEMFNERISVVFKKLRVVRMLDRKRNVLVYLTYSDRLIDGSPQNSVTAVPLGGVALPAT